MLIQDPPYFNVRPGGEYRQEAGRELVIPCAASGDPDIPTITWRKVCFSFLLFIQQQPPCNSDLCLLKGGEAKQE